MKQKKKKQKKINLETLSDDIDNVSLDLDFFWEGPVKTNRKRLRAIRKRLDCISRDIGKLKDRINASGDDLICMITGGC